MSPQLGAYYMRPRRLIYVFRYKTCRRDVPDGAPLVFRNYAALSTHAEMGVLFPTRSSLTDFRRRNCRKRTPLRRGPRAHLFVERLPGLVPVWVKRTIRKKKPVVPTKSPLPVAEVPTLHEQTGDREVVLPSSVECSRQGS